VYRVQQKVAPKDFSYFSKQLVRILKLNFTQRDKTETILRELISPHPIIYADMTDNSTKEFNKNASATTEEAAFFDYGWQLVASVEFYMNVALIVTGIIGSAANALVLYALIVHYLQESKKRGFYILIINQNLLDLCCCVLFVVCLSITVSNIYLTGALGYILCVLFINGNLFVSFMNASVVNLVCLTIERYLKVVYPFWSKKYIKRWVIYALIIFSWMGGILSLLPFGIATTYVAEGTCMALQLYWDIPHIKTGYGTFNIVALFIIPICILVYCYAHIVVVIRKQMRVMAGHNTEGSSQLNRAKWNVIQTMIIVSAFFVVAWFPANTYVMVVDNATSEKAIGHLVTLFLPYVNVSLNPFIYATKHEGVRRVLARMAICRKHDDAASVPATAEAYVTAYGQNALHT